MIHHKSRLKVWTSSDKVIRWVTTLFDVTVKQAESRVSIYKRGVLIGHLVPAHSSAVLIVYLSTANCDVWLCIRTAEKNYCNRFPS